MNLPDDLIPFAIGAGCAAVAGLICYFPARRGNTSFSLGVLAVLAVLFAWTFYRGNAAIGWDALGWFLFAIFVIGPAFVGGLIATLIARYRARRRSDPS